MDTLLDGGGMTSDQYTVSVSIQDPGLELNGGIQ